MSVSGMSSAGKESLKDDYGRERVSRVIKKSACD